MVLTARQRGSVSYIKSKKAAWHAMGERSPMTATKKNKKVQFPYTKSMILNMRCKRSPVRITGLRPTQSMRGRKMIHARQYPVK